MVHYSTDANAAMYIYVIIYRSTETKASQPSKWANRFDILSYSFFLLPNRTMAILLKFHLNQGDFRLKLKIVVFFCKFNTEFFFYLWNRKQFSIQKFPKWKPSERMWTLIVMCIAFDSIQFQVRFLFCCSLILLFALADMRCFFFFLFRCCCCNMEI